MKQQKEQNIQDKQLRKIISYRYEKKTQKLILDNYPDQWGQVLRIRDWSILRALSLKYCQLTSNKLHILFLSNFKNIVDLNLSFFLYYIFRFQLIRQLWDKISSQNKHLEFKTVKNKQLRVNEDHCLIGDQGAKHLIKGKWLKLKSLQLGTQVCICSWKYNNSIRISDIAVGTLEAVQLLKCIKLLFYTFNVVYHDAELYNKYQEENHKYKFYMAYCKNIVMPIFQVK